MSNTAIAGSKPEEKEPYFHGKDTLIICYDIRFDKLGEDEEPMALRVRLEDGREAVLSWKFAHNNVSGNIGFGDAYRVFLNGEKLYDLHAIDKAVITGVCINRKFVKDIREKAFAGYYDEITSQKYDVFPGSRCDEPWLVKPEDTDDPVNRTEWVTTKNRVEECTVKIAELKGNWVPLEWES